MKAEWAVWIPVLSVRMLFSQASFLPTLPLANPPAGALVMIKT